MKLYELLVIILVSIVLITSYSCDDVAVKKVNDDTVNCPKRWLVTNNDSVSYVIGDSALRIFGDSLNVGVGIEFRSLGTLVGDFEISINFHNYFVEGGSLGFFVQLYATAIGGATNNSLKATIGNVFPGLFGTRVGAGIDSAGTDPIIVALGNYAVASDTSGFFTIRRVGSTVEVIASTGDSSATITGVFYSLPLIIGVQYGSNFNKLAKTSVTLRRFCVTNGGGSVLDDYFDCNSIQQ
ncbi:MAG: hypothetical protein ISS16_05330 [Ignavibacteria bacterium]|nr:hypothetical protein [Bacteroidota bacterium]MBL7128392.1 hypothetical protein [Ignavibacteria bacterium]